MRVCVAGVRGWRVGEGSWRECGRERRRWRCRWAASAPKQRNMRQMQPLPPRRAAPRPSEGGVRGGMGARGPGKADGGGCGRKWRTGRAARGQLRGGVLRGLGHSTRPRPPTPPVRPRALENAATTLAHAHETVPLDRGARGVEVFSGERGARFCGNGGSVSTCLLFLSFRVREVESYVCVCVCCLRVCLCVYA